MSKKPIAVPIKPDNMTDEEWLKIEFEIQTGKRSEYPGGLKVSDIQESLIKTQEAQEKERAEFVKDAFTESVDLIDAAAKSDEK